MHHAIEVEDDVAGVTAEKPHLIHGSAGTVPLSKEAGTRCSTCSVRRSCMSPDMTQHELVKLEHIVRTRRVVRRGEALYRAGDRFESLYRVRAGSFKTVILHKEGLEHVAGFHLPGDTIGFDGVHADRYGCDAIALEDSIVCIIPFHLLELLCQEVKSIQHHLHRLLSREIAREASLMMQFGTMSASQRLAAFLIDLSGRFAARGYSRSEFNLRMTRDEIGSYLGMKLETVSRMLSRLQKEGIIEPSGKHIRIVDLDRLAQI